MTTFYKAQEARDIATNRRAILDEIRIIEPVVLDAIENGDTSAKIGPGSSTPVTVGFTNSATYYNAYSDPINNDTEAHRKARRQINEILKHFSSLNYQITMEREGATSTFNWIVKW